MQDKIQKIINDFGQCPDWEKKYEKLIQYGKDFKSMADSDKSEDLKVKGCQSQVWIKAYLLGDQIIFQGDSDALLVKGLVALVLKVYSGEAPSDILKTEPTFLK